MKISKLNINNFRHLENLDFDFTYPLDYKDKSKVGKPLEKICFIGQSGTGKTGLLDLIYNEIISFSNLRIINQKQILSIGKLYNPNIKIGFESNNIVYKNNFGEIEINNRIYELYNENYSGGAEDVLNNKSKMYYITAEILSNQNIKLFEDETVLLIERYKEIKEKVQNDTFFIIKFNENVQDAIWIGLLQENINYLQELLVFASEIISNGNVLDNLFQEKIKRWRTTNVNPLIEFSDKFDALLEKINLCVDLNDTKNIAPLKHKATDQNIPIKNTSTGTKQILLTSLILFKLDTKDSIILIDEPERSLYPDMQMDIMEHYQNLAPEAQFIVATHSPFIAASFEPEERFILSFDEKGKVKVNRGTSPIGDDPNDMLYNDFKVDYINKEGKKSYEEYLVKKRHLLFENDEKTKNKLQDEIEKIGDNYNF